MMLVIDKICPKRISDAFRWSKVIQTSPGTTSPSLAAEAQKCYENCYAWSFCLGFVRRMLQQTVKITDTEIEIVCAARYEDSEKENSETFFFKGKHHVPLKKNTRRIFH